MPALVPRPVDLAEPSAARLAQAMSDEMSALYGDGGASPAATADFSGPQAVFLVGSVAGEDVVCGGLRVLREGVGELKRMYVAPTVRGRGLGRDLLRGLLSHAREQGLTRVQLETGSLQPAAVGLSASEGFTTIAPYGHVREDPRSTCMALDL